MEPKFNKHSIIQAILSTLDTVDVKGYNNCSAIVGCIQYLNRLKDELTKEDNERSRQIETLMKKIEELEAKQNADSDGDN